MTTTEKSVDVPAGAHEGGAGHTAEDTPHGGVVTSNRPEERTDEVSATGQGAVTHHDAGSGRRREYGPRSPLVGERRESRVDDGQHMA